MLINLHGESIFSGHQDSVFSLGDGDGNGNGNEITGKKKNQVLLGNPI